MPTKKGLAALVLDSVSSPDEVTVAWDTAGVNSERSLLIDRALIQVRVEESGTHVRARYLVHKGLDAPLDLELPLAVDLCEPSISSGKEKAPVAHHQKYPPREARIPLEAQDFPDVLEIRSRSRPIIPRVAVVADDTLSPQDFERSLDRSNALAVRLPTPDVAMSLSRSTCSIIPGSEIASYSSRAMVGSGCRNLVRR